MSLRPAYLLLAVLLSTALSACKSTSSSEKVVDPPGSARIVSSTRTPAHNLSRYEYPFDAAGNYMETWAAEGEKRAGRTAYVSSRSSHSHYSRSSSSGSRSGGTYTVRPGDSLWGIAIRYKTTVSALKSANGLRSDTIRIGQRLRIP